MSQFKNRANVWRRVGALSCVALTWAMVGCGAGSDISDGTPEAAEAELVAPAHDSREIEAGFAASEPPVAIEIVEAGQESADDTSEQSLELETGLTPEFELPSAPALESASELGVLRSALSTAPNCIDRFGAGHAATVINNCGRTEFVKVVFAFGRDSSCTRIPAGAVFTFTSGSLSSFDGAFSC